MKISRRFTLIRTLMAILIAMAMTLVIVFLVSDTPLEAIKYFLIGPVMKASRLANVVETMLPLLFTGLSVSLIARSGVFNLASEGSFFIGGSMAALCACLLNIGGVMLPVVSLAVAGVAGMLCMLVPAVLKLRFNASEIVSSLMFNYVAFYLGSYLIRVFARNPDSGSLQSLPFPENAILLRLIPGTRIHFGLIVGVLLTVFVWMYLYKSRWGYKMRLSGSNSKFATYSGIEVGKSILIAQALAGLACGIGGGCEMLGMYSAFKWVTAPGPGFGWDGIIVATLAGNNPALVPVGAFFLAYMRVGADIMTRMTDVQNEIVSVIQGVVIILIVAKRFLGKWEKRAIFKEATANAKHGEEATS